MRRNEFCLLEMIYDHLILYLKEKETKQQKNVFCVFHNSKEY